MRRLTLTLATVMWLTSLAVPMAAKAQEATSAASPVYRESFKDLIDRSKAAETKLKELGSVIEMAVSCNEQGLFYKPIDGSAGECIPMPIPPITCQCSSSSGGHEDYHSRTNDMDNDGSPGW